MGTSCFDPQVRSARSPSAESLFVVFPSVVLARSQPKRRKLPSRRYHTAWRLLIQIERRGHARKATAAGQGLNLGDRVEGLGNFVTPTGESPQFCKTNEDDSVVRWDNNSRVGVRQFWRSNCNISIFFLDDCAFDTEWIPANLRRR